jgi:repressor LexA
MTTSDAPTKRQTQILDFIKSFIAEKHYAPSVRQIGKAVNLASPSTVHMHLQALENKGLISRGKEEARAIVVLDKPDPNAPPATNIIELDRNTVALPVLGRVAAGEPIFAEQNVEDTFALPQQVVGDTSSFMLTIKGESMIDAGIYDGDYVVVKEQSNANNGDIVVALLGEEATVKTFYKEKDRIRLQPQNQTMEPIYATDAKILGKVVALLRSL